MWYEATNRLLRRFYYNDFWSINHQNYITMIIVFNWIYLSTCKFVPSMSLKDTVLIRACVACSRCRPWWRDRWPWASDIGQSLCVRRLPSDVQLVIWESRWNLAPFSNSGWDTFHNLAPFPAVCGIIFILLLPRSTSEMMVLISCQFTLVLTWK